jgi:hypothetical protein
MKKSVKVAIAGAVLFVVGFAVGVGITLFGMIDAFQTIAQSGAKARPEQVAEAVHSSMMATWIGLGVSFLGLCLGLGGLIVYFKGRKG